MNTSVGAMYNDLQGLGVDVAELKLKANTAIAFMDNFLVIDRSRCKTTAKERTVLAHEAGHYLSGAFYLAYSPYEIKEQAENRASELRQAMACGFTEPWQLAEYFSFDEDYIKKALHYWTECRGVDFNQTI